MLTLDIHNDTRRIADALSACARGSTITLAALSLSIGQDIRRRRYLIYSAMRIAQRETGAVFVTERGKGYRRLLPEEVGKIGQTARARIRGIARRGSKAITAGISGANEIDGEVMRKILAEQSVLGVLEHISRDRNLPVIAEVETRPLSVAQTARDFLRSIGA